MRTTVKIGAVLILSGGLLLVCVFWVRNHDSEMNRFFPNSAQASLTSLPAPTSGEFHFVGTYKQLSEIEAVKWYEERGFSVNRDRDTYFGYNRKGVRFKMTCGQGRIEVWHFPDD